MRRLNSNILFHFALLGGWITFLSIFVCNNVIQGFLKGLLSYTLVVGFIFLFQLGIGVWNFKTYNEEPSLRKEIEDARLQLKKDGFFFKGQ
mmetsp:Transcript_2042/g.3029  ORF Transcript_2042/g.3029 Transcript_2042/m.3029 type:complete len:91 (+) Transcript_2042:42-314(+)